MTWKFHFLWSISFWLAESVLCISCIFWLVERYIWGGWQALTHFWFGRKGHLVWSWAENRYMQFHTILSKALQLRTHTFIFLKQISSHTTLWIPSGFLNEEQKCKISEIIDNLLLQRSWSSSILLWTKMLLLHLKNFFRVLRKVK